jgi:siderophore synthetase component
MTSTTDPAALAGAALAGHAPELVAGFNAALPRAMDVVGQRLLAAAWRERLGTAREVIRPARRYGFDRIGVSGPVAEHPVRLLDRLGVRSPALADELTDACVNMAVGYARRAGLHAELREQARAQGAPDTYRLAEQLPGDDQLVFFDRLTTEGHNLHPCGRTRLGWGVPDLLAHDLESPRTEVGFVAVRAPAHLGDDVGELLRAGYPWLPAAPPGYRLQPVHAWQLATVLPRRYRDLLSSGVLRPVDGVLSGAPTTALRTVVLEADAHGVRRHLKLSLDIQVTSTRRTISVASTRNGPVLSALLTRLTAGEPRVLLLPELAGAAVTSSNGPSRDLSAIVRGGLTGRLHPGEVAIPGSALIATAPVTGGTVLDELLARYPGTPLGFLTDYANLLLPPLLRLARVGVGLEAHLQNSIPIFQDGVPRRIAFRDFAGLRLHLPRVRQHADPGLRLWPGSVIGTEDLDTMRAKLAYTALQAHLGELVVALVDGYQVDERDAWHAVRGVLDEAARDPATVDPSDHAFLTARLMPHKALVRMRLSNDGDLYLPVHNPLHAP